MDFEIIQQIAYFACEAWAIEYGLRQLHLSSRAHRRAPKVRFKRRPSARLDGRIQKIANETARPQESTQLWGRVCEHVHIADAKTERVLRDEPLQKSGYSSAPAYGTARSARRTPSRRKGTL
jgi:hypothetical protein